MKSLRQIGFWMLDRTRGGQVSKHLRNIEQIMGSESPLYGEDPRIMRILEHATKNVPFYEQYVGCDSLSDFPVINKGVLVEQADRMLVRGIDKSALHMTSTSGSTGTPLRVFHDHTKRIRASAEAIFWGEKAGYQVGNKLYYLKVWSDRNRMKPLVAKLRNVVAWDTARMLDEDIVDLLGKISKEPSKVSIVSYSSILDMLGRFLDDPRNENFNARVYGKIASIVGQSESLSSHARDSFRRNAGVDAYNRYGLEELGIIGQQVESENDRYLVNRASQHVEVLSMDSDEVAPPGELGRIVVTDLVSMAQPMIRYDTGDLGCFDVSHDGQLDYKWLSRVSGRKADQIYDVDDRPLTTLFMYKLWWQFPEVRQYQVVQLDKGRYRLRLNVAEKNFSEHTFIEGFKAIVGESSEVSIELTEEELVYSSGKRRALVSKYTPSRSH